MRVLTVREKKEAINLMREINVDPYGIKIMLPKTEFFLLKVNSLKSTAANILKQEILSLGADLALSKNSLNLKAKKTDCLLMGTRTQLSSLASKLKRQPFGLEETGKKIIETIDNYAKKDFVLRTKRYSIDLEKKSLIMAIVNLTPDSFSQDGLYGAPVDYILSKIENLIEEGADIIDLGGESARPGSRPISAKEELSRIMPVLKRISKKVKVPISVDTRKAEVAKAALENGADIINDISGLKDKRMPQIISAQKGAVVIMHMLRTPLTMQDNPCYNNLMDEITQDLKLKIDKAQFAGIGRSSIVIDPGIGFGKNLKHNLEILKKLPELKSLGKPIMVGVSRKSFIGKLTGAKVDNRLTGTISACVISRLNGAKIFRVHDVKETKEALLVADKILE